MIRTQYNIIRRKVKFVRIKISNDKTVTVIAPLNLPQKELLSVIAKKEKWINQKLDYFSSQKIIPVIGPDYVHLFGERYFLNRINKVGIIFEVDHKNKNIMISSSITITMIQKYIRAFAKKNLVDRIQYLADYHNITFNKVFIRTVKTKWGNCSNKKNISLNSWLIHFPLAVIDYVILHELVHTRIMNHSKEFWLTLSRICPSYKLSHQWLQKQNFEIF